MNKKRFLIPALAAIAFAAAGSEPQLVVKSTDGGADVHRLAEVTRVRFVPGGLEVDNLSRPSATSYQFGEIDRVVFDCDGAYSAIEKVTADAGGARIGVYPSPAVESITVTGAGDGPCSLRVYAADGRCVAAFDNYEGGKIDVSAFPAGVYIVNAGAGTAKFFKAAR